MIQKYYLYALILITAIGFASCTKNPQKASPQVQEKTDRYQVLRSDLFTGEIKVETRIEDEQVFTEGPAVDSDGIVYFTNIRVNKILKVGSQCQKSFCFQRCL